MTNREYLIKTNPYDVLIDFNRKMKKRCVMEVLHPNFWDRCGHYEDCETCIAEWLNEERGAANATR